MLTYHLDNFSITNSVPQKKIKIKNSYIMGHYQKSVDFGVFQIKNKSSMKPKNIMATTLL